MAFGCRFSGGIFSGDGSDTNPYILTSIGAAGWIQQINQPGTSFAGWTSGGGTWSSDGTSIIQTDTAATIRNAAFNTRYPFAIAMSKADIRINSFNGGDCRAGFYIGSALIYIKSTDGGTTYSVVAENRGSAVVTNTSVTGTGVGTLFTVKALMTGGQSASFWVNGIFIGTTEMGNTGDASQFNLYTYSSSSSFRNIQSYTMSLPI